MIILNPIVVSITPTEAVVPYTFTFYDAAGVITFTTPVVEVTSVGASGIITVTVGAQATSSAALALASPMVTIRDGNNCTTELALNSIDPCNMLGTGIQVDTDLNATVSFTGGVGPFTYDWNFDSAVLQMLTQDENQPTVTFRVAEDITPPPSTPISVTITDGNNCSITIETTYVFCVPLMGTKSVLLNCNPNALAGCSVVPVSQFRDLPLATKGCASEVIDWSTLDITVLSGLCIVNNEDGTISLAASESVAAGVHVLSMTVRTEKGVISEAGNLIITVPTCAASGGIGSGPSTSELTADDIVTTVIRVPLINNVSSLLSPVDWSSFSIVQAPIYGTALFNADQELEYTITDLVTDPDRPDIVVWEVLNENGEKTRSQSVIVRGAIPAPVAVTETLCGECGVPIGPTDVTANDTGDIDKFTIEVISADVDLIITKDSNHDLTITPNYPSGINNFFSYRVANPQGVYSNTVNSLVKNVCGGRSTVTKVQATCIPGLTFSLTDYMTDIVNFIGAGWSEAVGSTYGVQGGVINNPVTTGDVDFTGITAGTYTFEYNSTNQAPCVNTHTGTLIIELLSAPVLATTSVINNGDGTFTYTGQAVSVQGGTLAVQVEGAPAVFQSSPAIIGGVLTFTAYYAQVGNNDLQLNVDSICNTQLQIIQVIVN